jgi:hypothetical protein
LLKPWVDLRGVYNSKEREDEHVSLCAEGTRKAVLDAIIRWIRSKDKAQLFYWLSGPAGAGKSTIAQTICKLLEELNLLACSHFFSRRNPGRSDMSKFIPSLAYQISLVLPAVHEPLQLALKDIFLAEKSLEYQCTKLIAEPLIAAMGASPTSPYMTIVIDGLDEYIQGHSSMPLSSIIHTLVNCLRDAPIRIFFTSRAEHYIQDVFRQIPHSHMALQDFNSVEEVQEFLTSRLRKVQIRAGLPESWPTASDVKQLAKTSEGFFIYAETVAKFVDDLYQDPREKLSMALQSHDGGLYALYSQVLTSALHFHGNQIVLGSFMVLRDYFDKYENTKKLPLRSFSKLLRKETLQVRIALRGCVSVLQVPDTDDDYIRPFHASLLDFVTSQEGLQFKFSAQHEHMLRHCLQTMVEVNDERNGDHHVL